MLNLEAVPHGYEEAVRLLTEWHRDPGDHGFTAYSFPDPDGVVRLVEVSERFPSVQELRPVGFGRSADFPFPSAVALVSPEDWARIERGELSLPPGWRWEERRKVWPRDEE